MSRVNPADVGLPREVRVDKAGAIAGFSDLHVAINSTDQVCPRCGYAMIKHGSYTKRMAHAVGKTPCTLSVKVSRYRCKRRGTTKSADIPFVSAVSPAITDALENHIIDLLRRRQTITEVARACDVSHDMVRSVVDRFHVAKDGVACMDDARRRLQKGASNGADIKRRARKLVVNRGKRRREHESEPWVEIEKKTIRDVLALCDPEHSHLRQAYLTLQLHCIWQDHPWTDRCTCEKALDNWIMKASGLAVPEMRRFAKTVSRYEQYLITATITHTNSARAESTNDKIKELKRKSRGFGSFEETRRRLLLAFGAPGAVEGATSYKRRKERQAAVFAPRAPKKRRKKR